MDGDLLGVGPPPSDNVVNPNHNPEPSLLDFASPSPPAPVAADGDTDLFQQDAQPLQPQQAPFEDDLLGFGAAASFSAPSATATATPTPTTSQQSPLVDLFGAPPPATTQQPSQQPSQSQQQSQQQQQQQPLPLDLFGAPVPAPAPAPAGDGSAAASEDPFGAFFQTPPPQPSSQSVPNDPFSAVSPETVDRADRFPPEVSNPVNENGNDDGADRTEAPKSSPLSAQGVEVGEEEKKEQDSSTSSSNSESPTETFEPMPISMPIQIPTPTETAAAESELLQESLEESSQSPTDNGAEKRDSDSSATTVSSPGTPKHPGESDAPTATPEETANASVDGSETSTDETKTATQSVEPESSNTTEQEPGPEESGNAPEQGPERGNEGTKTGTEPRSEDPESTSANEREVTTASSTSAELPSTSTEQNKVQGDQNSNGETRANEQTQSQDSTSSSNVTNEEVKGSDVPPEDLNAASEPTTTQEGGTDTPTSTTEHVKEQGQQNENKPLASLPSDNEVTEAGSAFATDALASEPVSKKDTDESKSAEEGKAASGTPQDQNQKPEQPKQTVDANKKEAQKESPPETASNAGTNEKKAESKTEKKSKASSSTMATTATTTTTTTTTTTEPAAPVTNRFASFKNMAGNIQLQQKKAEAANRFASFKSMAGKVAARGKAELAGVKVPQQLANVQVSKRLQTVAKLPLFGGDQRNESSDANANSHAAAAATATASTLAPASKTPAQPKAESKKKTGSVAKPAGSAAASVGAAAATVTKSVAPKESVESTIAASAAASNTDKPSKDSGGSKPETGALSPQHPTAPDADSTRAETTTETAANNTTTSGIAASKQTEIKQESPEEEQPTTTSPPSSEKPGKDSTASDSAQTAQLPPVPQAAQREPSGGSPSPESSGDKEGEKKVAQENEQSTPIPPEESAGAKKVNGNDKTSDTTSEIPPTAKTTPASAPKIASDKPKDVEKGSATDARKEIPETDDVASSSKAPQSEPAKPAQKQSVAPAPVVSNEVEVLRKELHAAHTLIMQLQHHENVEEDRPGDTVMVELQANLQKEMTRRAEAEEKARVATAQSQRVGEEYNMFKITSKSSLDNLTKKLETLSLEKEAMEKELNEIREERDEQARKEMALTTRLNAAKKKEAVKANAAEHYEEQVDQLESSVKDYQAQVESLSAERNQLQGELEEWKQYAEKRTKQLENALNDEKKLNDERKRKMKGFVEAKTEEVRLAKADYISLQTELDQNTHSLKELNQRYKQLHAQWVQSQTRNRELQRDAMRMKKDSEKMHKVGDSLEARLSRSAQQSEDHKNKRIHARNELMSVLGQLEAERAVNSRLQESIKMTFTPKALSQQQTIREALDDLEGALHKLSVRVGRPLPPNPNNSSTPFSDNQNPDDDESAALNATTDGDADEADEGGHRPGTTTLSEINTNRAIQKLENETQRVSQSIMNFSAGIERMHNLLDGAGTRNCVDVLSQLLALNGPAPTSGEIRRGPARGGQRYGQISSNMR